MPDPKNYKMKPGSREKNTPGTFRSDQENKLKGHTVIARKKYNLGKYSDLGFKDVGVKNNTVQLKTNKYPTTSGQQMVAKNLSKLNPGMKFNVQYSKDK
jgi:hypothetical protein